MCVKQLPKQLNSNAEEWRPSTSLPPPILPLPHALFTYPQPPLYAAPPPLPYSVSLSFLHNHTISDHKNSENIDAAAIDKRPEKGLKKFLPSRLRKALKSRPPPPPPPPPKLEWRPKNAPPPDFKASGDAAAVSSETTLMIKNIPNQLRRDFMLKFLDGLCQTHSVAYDFFYLPFDFRRLGNLGYAFVNFTTPNAAKMMKKILSRFKWHGIYTDEGELLSSNKVCEMKWARIQGKEALMRRFQESSFVCDDEEFLPVLLDPPRDGSDPNPPPPVNLGRICRRSN